MAHLNTRQPTLPEIRQCPRLTHPNDVTEYAVSERKIAGDGDSNVDYTSSAYTRDDNARCTKVRIVVYFIQD